MVLLLGIFYHPTEATYRAVELMPVITTHAVVKQFLSAVPKYAREVTQSILPVLCVFLIFQIFSKHFRRRHILRMCIGFLYTVIGLILFLTGVNVGFAPVGNLLGRGLTDGWLKWLMVPVGILIGYYIVKAEPAVQLLNEQVEDLTGGAI